VTICCQVERIAGTNPLLETMPNAHEANTTLVTMGRTRIPPG